MHNIVIALLFLVVTSFSGHTTTQFGNEIFTVQQNGRNLTFTARPIKEDDLPQMQKNFVAAYGHQYQRWTLADLGKESAIDPRTGKPFTSIPSWLEVVAKGEADEIMGELYGAIVDWLDGKEVDWLDGKEADSNRV